MGATTNNNWHRRHLKWIETGRRCDLCGGLMQDSGERHERCRLRKLNGWTTPKLPDPVCPCAACKHKIEEPDLASQKL